MAVKVEVDGHSHVFNAEDLPIDGFIKALSPVPRLLTGVVSVPLDRLAAWAAPGSREEQVLLALLAAPARPESAFQAESPRAELVSDAELDHLLVTKLGPVPVGSMPESAAGTEDLMAAQLATWPIDQRVALDQWLREQDVPVGESGARPEGLVDSGAWALARATALRRAVKLFVAALRRATQFRHEIAGELATTYDQVALFTPALVDFTFTANDRPSTSVSRQIALHSLVAKVSMAGLLPGAPDARVHPFVGFCPHREVATSELDHWDPTTGTPCPYVPYADPAAAGPADRSESNPRFAPDRARALSRPDGDWDTAVLRLDDVTRSVDLVRHAVELGGFVGVKIYPPAGFLPLGNVLRFGELQGRKLDAALRALYSYCVEMDLPILTHAASSNGFGPGYDDLAAPEGWAVALAEYPGLRVCFGHFGHLHGERDVDGIGEDGARGWPSRFADLIDTHDHVYADVGYSRAATSPAHEARFVGLLRRLLGPADASDPLLAKRRRRIIYGSDFWMNTLEPGHAAYHTKLKQIIADSFEAPIPQWFLGENALRLLGFVDDDGDPAEGNANRRRLLHFYDASPHPAPEWLQAR